MTITCFNAVSALGSWATLCAVAIGLTAAPAQARDLRIVTIDSAPFGFGFTNHVMPYARTALAVASGEADFVIRCRSDEIEAGSVQVGGVLSLPTIVIGKASLHLEGLADLHGKTVATPRGGRFDEAFEADAAITKYPVSDYPTALRMLTSGRVDAALGSSVGLLYNAHQAGLEKRQAFRQVADRYPEGVDWDVRPATGSR